jgi:ribose transport system substrate-binding protein
LSSNLSSVKRRPFFALSLAVLLLGAAASCGDGGKPPAAGGRLRIAVVPKGTTHEFWKSIRAGAEKAGRELDVEIVWKGPAKEDDRIGQIQVLEDFVAKKVDGLVLAPLDDAALAPVVAEAAAAGVPTVVIDSDLVGDRHVSFVATDNERGGRLAAERLGALMGGKGKALMLRYQEGSASTTAREKGFVDALREKFPGVELVSDNQYGGATAETAYKAAENLLVARKGRRRRLLLQRVDDLRHAARARGREARGRGPVRRVRRQPEARRSAARAEDPRTRAAGSRTHGVRGREGDGRP